MNESYSIQTDLDLTCFSLPTNTLTSSTILTHVCNYLPLVSSSFYYLFCSRCSVKCYYSSAVSIRTQLGTVITSLKTYLSDFCSNSKKLVLFIFYYTTSRLLLQDNLKVFFFCVIMLLSATVVSG